MNAGLFRKVALERHASPEQLDYLIQVTRPRGWLNLLALCAVIGLALYWSIAARIPVTVAGRGIIVPQGGISRVAIPADGVLREVLVQAGDSVAKDQTLAVLETPDGPRTVISPHAGRVLELLLRPGQVAARGTVVAAVEPRAVPLVAHLYVPVETGRQIQPGMVVRLSPAGVSSQAHGYLLGRVEAITPYPATEAGAMALYGNEQVVRQLLAGGPAMAVQVRLDADPATPSGYRWSSGVGPPGPVASGTFAGAAFVIGERQPVSLLLPFLRQAPAAP